MMNEKLKLTEAVIVEGRYDKLRLSNIIDAFIIETGGFSVFKDKEKMAFIKKIARERGIIILTDSDHAGFMIRNYISSGVPKEQITHVYIPDVYGKERRKASPSKEGKLGVEGMTKQVLLDAFKKANVNATLFENPNPITTYDLYEAGLTGAPDAKTKRRMLMKSLDLPEFLSTDSLLSCINNTMTREEFKNYLQMLY